MRYISQYTHYIRAIKQTMLDRSQEVCNPLFSLFSPGSFLMALTQYVPNSWLPPAVGKGRARKVTKGLPGYLSTDLVSFFT